MSTTLPFIDHVEPPPLTGADAVHAVLGVPPPDVAELQEGAENDGDGQAHVERELLWTVTCCCCDVISVRGRVWSGRRRKKSC